MIEEQKTFAPARSGDLALISRKYPNWVKNYARAFGIGVGHSKLTSSERADLEIQRQKREACKQLFVELIADLDDLGSVNFRALWYFRANTLKEKGCWWHYAVLRRRARDKIKSTHQS